MNSEEKVILFLKNPPHWLKAALCGFIITLVFAFVGRFYYHLEWSFAPLCGLYNFAISLPFNTLTNFVAFLSWVILPVIAGLLGLHERKS